MNPTLNRKLFLPLTDIISDGLTTLSFQIDDASTSVLLVIQNKDRIEEIAKTTDSSGKFTIQVKDTEETPTDLAAGESWFNRYAGVFYFKVYVSGSPLPIAVNFEGVSFEFKNSSGTGLNPTINLTGNTSTPPVTGGALGNAILGSTFILA